MKAVKSMWQSLGASFRNESYDLNHKTVRAPVVSEAILGELCSKVA
jgi:hypothetical protein